MRQNWQRFGAFITSRGMRSTSGYYAAYVFLGLAAGFTGPILPHLAEQTRVGLDTISFIFIARSFGYLVGAFFSGRLFDRVPGNPLFAVAVLLGGVALAGMPFISTTTLLLVLISMLGLAEGTIDVGANTLILWVHDKKAGPFMNALHAFWGVGTLLGPIAVAQILLLTGVVKWVFWLFALLAIPIALWLFFAPSPVTRVRPVAAGTKPKINLLLVGGIILIFILYVGAEIGFGSWLFSYATRTGMVGETVAAYLTSAFWTVFTLGRLLGIPLAGRFKPHIIILTDMVGCLVSAGLVLYFSHSVPMLWLGTMLLGLSMASIFPTVMLFAEERVHLTSQITSWFMIGTGCGTMLLPWLIGQSFTRFGPQATMVIVFFDLVALLMVFWGLKTLFPSKKVKIDG